MSIYGPNYGKENDISLLQNQLKCTEKNARVSAIFGPNNIRLQFEFAFSWDKIKIFCLLILCVTAACVPETY
jgi:hypothetical protein